MERTRKKRKKEKAMRPIWFFVGLILCVMGMIILMSGIVRLIWPFGKDRILAGLHPDLWWGGGMILAGGIFLYFNRHATSAG